MAAKPTVIIVTERLLFPGREGTRVRIMELIRGLRASGYSVALVARRPKEWANIVRTRLLVDRLILVDAPGFGGGSPFSFDVAPFAAALDRAVTALRPRAVIAEYLWMAPCLDVVGSRALRCVDTIDLMHPRAAMYAGEGQGAWVTCSPEEESALLRRADVVIAIQRTELAEFRAMVPDRRVICLPHGLTVEPLRPSTNRAGSPEAVMFVGSVNQGNAAGLQWFLRECWPEVRVARPTAELRLYGDVVKRLPPSDLAGVQRIGYIPSLREAYADAHVVINPVMLGTGLKIKTVEALAYGRAVVTTSVGAEGLEDAAGEAFLLEDESGAFAAAVARLLGDGALRRSLERRGRALAEERFSRRAALAEFHELLQLRGSGAA